MKLTLKWDIGILNKIIGMIFKNNINITTSHLRNIQRLFDSCDVSIYQTRSVIIKRIQFIQKALRAKLDEKIEDDDLIISYCRPDNNDPVVEDIINNLTAYKKMNHAEITFINKYVEDKLVHGLVSQFAQEMQGIVEKILNDEYETYAEASNVVDDWMRRFKYSKTKVLTTYTNSMICLNDPLIEDKVKDVLTKLGNSRSTFITGAKMLNQLLSPGFRSGKLYMLLGITGGFKSAMLIKVIIDVVKFNAKTYVPKREGHKPVVLYLTMENTKEESFARIFNMSISSDDIENYSSQYITNEMRKANLINNEEMEIIIAYKANRSVDTSYIRELIDQLDEQGKEVALLAFDYVKRIKPEEPAANEKEELKNVTNELRQIAIDYFIPVVSAQQMNRAGAATVNSVTRDKKADAAKFLGLENIGSAWEIAENADMTIILNLERRISDNKLFLTFHRVKERYKCSKLDYFNQPFEEDNEFKLVDDLFNSEPAGVISLASDLEGVNADDLFESKRGRKNVNQFGNNVVKTTKTDDLFDLTPLT